MKKLILLICIAACSLTAASSYASDNHMSREEFKSNCELSGGTYSEDYSGSMTCAWPDGAFIKCDEGEVGSCRTGNYGTERVTAPDDNRPQYDPNFDGPQSRYEGTASFEDPTANEAEIQKFEELSAMKRLEKMESIIKEKMYEDIFGE